MTHSCQRRKEKENEERERGLRDVIRSSSTCVWAWAMCSGLCVGVRGYFGCSRGIQAWDRPSSYNGIIFYHIGRKGEGRGVMRRTAVVHPQNFVTCWMCLVLHLSHTHTRAHTCTHVHTRAHTLCRLGSNWSDRLGQARRIFFIMEELFTENYGLIFEWRNSICCHLPQSWSIILFYSLN